MSFQSHLFVCVSCMDQRSCTNPLMCYFDSCSILKPKFCLTLQQRGFTELQRKWASRLALHIESWKQVRLMNRELPWHSSDGVNGWLTLTLPSIVTFLSWWKFCLELVSSCMKFWERSHPSRSVPPRAAHAQMTNNLSRATHDNVRLCSFSVNHNYLRVHMP